MTLKTGFFLPVVSAGGLVFGTVFKDTDTHDVGSNVRVLQSSVLMFAHMQMMQQYIQMKKQGGNCFKTQNISSCFNDICYGLHL